MGVVYLVVLALAIAVTFFLGLPAVLLGRLLESLTYGSRITWEVVLLSILPVLGVAWSLGGAGVRADAAMWWEFVLGLVKGVKG